MKIVFSAQAMESLDEAPELVKRAMRKQIMYLTSNLLHPSLRAKKYSQVADLWQARINKSWRFYFRINENIYEIVDVKIHPK